MSGAEEYAKIAFQAALIFAVIFAAHYTLHTLKPGMCEEDEGYKGELCYRVSIVPGYDSVVENGTFYLPLPWNGNATISLAEASVPSNWKVGIIETEYGKMLKVETGRILPYHPGDEWPGIEVCLNVSEPVDVPEFVLKPKFNVTSCENVTSCLSYDSVIYTDCNGRGEIHIDVKVKGSNCWWKVLQRYRYWNQTSYKDWIQADCSCSGWIKVKGELAVYNHSGRVRWCSI